MKTQQSKPKPIKAQPVSSNPSFYRHHVFFCTNQREDGRPCCDQYRAKEARDHLKRRCKEAGIHQQGKVRINTAGCMDRCELGPVIVIYPEGTWYTYTDQEDLDEIFESHLKEGKVVERLRLG